MKRVLLVIKADGTGGAQRSMANLVRALEADGAGFELITLRRDAPGPKLLARWPRRVLAFPSPAPLERWRQWRWLRRRIARGGFDVVVGFGPIANGLVSLAKPRRGPRTIVTERGDPFIPARRTWNRLFLWTYRRADLLVVLTDGLAEEMKREWRRPRELRAIPNSLAPEVPIVARESARERVIAAVGRLAPVKRFGDLIEAFALLGRRGEGWTLRLIGDGEERTRLESLARARKIADRVRFTGFLDAPWRELAHADLFVLSSQNEGFGNVLLEAMASGCAVVASDCRFGPRHVIEDGVSGVLYPVGDVARLTEVLGELIADPARRDALARAGAVRVEAFAETVVAPLWLRAIEVPGRERAA